jgi:hypothetical protein
MIRPETPKTSEKQGFPSEAQQLAQQLAQRTPQADPDLLAIIERWPALPEAVKAGILAMVREGPSGR